MQILIEFVINMTVIGNWLHEPRAFTQRTHFTVDTCIQRSNETELHMTFENRLYPR